MSSADDRTEVWVLKSERVLLVQPSGLGVPAAAVVASDGTIGGSYFDRECVNTFTTWQQAVRSAEVRAKTLGYRVEYSDPRYDFEGDDEYEDGLCSA